MENNISNVLGDCSLKLFRGGKEIFSSTDSGIKPILSLYHTQKELLLGSTIYDKVIGKAAAVVAILGGVSEVNAVLISQPASDILKQYHIPYCFDTEVSCIKNRKGDGMCPMEKSVLKDADAKDAFKGLMRFIDSMN